MKTRVCRLWFEIETNGQAKRYSLAPLSAEGIGSSFVAGFRVTNVSEQPQPVYLVRVRANGNTYCSCPAFAFDERAEREPNTPPHQPPASCKHTLALEACGAITRNMLEVLKARTKLLDTAEERVQQLTKNRDIEREATCRNADSLRKTIAQLESELHAVSQRELQLQTSLPAVQAAAPKTRRPRKARVAA